MSADLGTIYSRKHSQIISELSVQLRLPVHSKLSLENPKLAKDLLACNDLISNSNSNISHSKESPRSQSSPRSGSAVRTGSPSIISRVSNTSHRSSSVRSSSSHSREKSSKRTISPSVALRQSNTIKVSSQSRSTRDRTPPSSFSTSLQSISKLNPKASSTFNTSIDIPPTIFEFPSNVQKPAGLKTRDENQWKNPGKVKDLVQFFSSKVSDVSFPGSALTKTSNSNSGSPRSAGASSRGTSNSNGALKNTTRSHGIARKYKSLAKAKILEEQSRIAEKKKQEEDRIAALIKSREDSRYRGTVGVTARLNATKSLLKIEKERLANKEAEKQRVLEAKKNDVRNQIDKNKKGSAGSVGSDKSLSKGNNNVSDVKNGNEKKGLDILTSKIQQQQDELEQLAQEMRRLEAEKKAEEAAAAAAAAASEAMLIGLPPVSVITDEDRPLTNGSDVGVFVSENTRQHTIENNNQNLTGEEVEQQPEFMSKEAMSREAFGKKSLKTNGFYSREHHQLTNRSSSVNIMTPALPNAAATVSNTATSDKTLDRNVSMVSKDSVVVFSKESSHQPSIDATMRPSASSFTRGKSISNIQNSISRDDMSHGVVVLQRSLSYPHRKLTHSPDESESYTSSLIGEVSDLVSEDTLHLLDDDKERKKGIFGVRSTIKNTPYLGRELSINGSSKSNSIASTTFKKESRSLPQTLMNLMGCATVAENESSSKAVDKDKDDTSRNDLNNINNISTSSFIVTGFSSDPENKMDPITKMKSDSYNSRGIGILMPIKRNSSPNKLNQQSSGIISDLYRNRTASVDAPPTEASTDFSYRTTSPTSMQDVQSLSAVLEESGYSGKLKKPTITVEYSEESRSL